MWVEHGEGKAKKIIFSSTFDAVVEAGDEGDDALYESALAPAVGAAIDGKLGCVLCVGIDGGKRGKRHALLGAPAERALRELLLACGERGATLGLAALHVQWETLSDLLTTAHGGASADAALAELPFALCTGGATATTPKPSGGGDDGGAAGPSLWGARGVVVESAAAGAASLAAAVAAAAERPTFEVGHVAVQLTISPGGGQLLLVDAAPSGAAERLEVLGGTYAHRSHAMLLRSLAKPATRPVGAEAALLPRLLRPMLDGGATSRLLVCVEPSAKRELLVETLRMAQQAAKAKHPKGDGEARQSAVLEYLQAQIAAAADFPESPSVAAEEEALRAAVGDGSALEGTLAAARAERAELQAALDDFREGEGGSARAEAEAEAEAASWAAEEEAVRSQLAAERVEAEALREAVQKAGEAAERAGNTQAKAALKEQVDQYEHAVEAAWEDVQRAQRQAEEAEARFDRARDETRQSAAEKEEMESTLLDVASDLENLARNYRQHGSPAMAVPLYVSALAIFEKTLGADHPQVASNLVNLGNAFCDQQKHIEAVPVYLRALAIDEKALGHDHPEVAMDLSNLGIAYRALGRADIATGLFERAHKLMLNAAGPDDPKTQAILRNLG